SVSWYLVCCLVRSYTDQKTSCVFFFTTTAPPEIYTLSLHDALPISACRPPRRLPRCSPRCPAGRSARARRRSSGARRRRWPRRRSEEHTSELQSLRHLVCRLLLEKKKPTTLTMQQCIANEHIDYSQN